MQTWAEMCWTWRHRHRFTQRRAAQEMGVALTTWSRWERGLTEPTGDNGRDAVRMMMMRDEKGTPRPLPPGIYKGDDAITIVGDYRP